MVISTESNGVPPSKEVAAPPASEQQQTSVSRASDPVRPPHPIEEHKLFPLILTSAIVLMMCLLVLASVSWDTWLSKAWL